MPAAIDRILLVAPAGAARDALAARLLALAPEPARAVAARVTTCEALSEACALLGGEPPDQPGGRAPARSGWLLVVAGPLGRAAHADLRACCRAAPTLVVRVRRQGGSLGDLLDCGVAGVLAADSAAQHLAAALGALVAGERFLDRALAG